MNFCLIGFGKLSSLHLYVLYCLISKFLWEFIFSFNSIKNSIKEEDNYGIFYFSPVLNDHCMIKYLYMYIGFIFFSLFFSYIFKNKEDSKKKFIDHSNFTELKHIHNTSNLKITIFRNELIIMSLFFVFHLEMNNITYYIGISGLDFWIFNIFFTIYFMELYFHIKHYKHQLYSLLFVFITNLIILYISEKMEILM